MKPCSYHLLWSVFDTRWVSSTVLILKLGFHFEEKDDVARGKFDELGGRQVKAVFVWPKPPPQCAASGTQQHEDTTVKSAESSLLDASTVYSWTLEDKLMTAMNFEETMCIHLIRCTHTSSDLIHCPTCTCLTLMTAANCDHNGSWLWKSGQPDIWNPG